MVIHETAVHYAGLDQQNIMTSLYYNNSIYSGFIPYFTSKLIEHDINNKRIRILKIQFNLLCQVSSLSNCTLFASSSKFCLRRFFIFLTSEARFSAFNIRTRTWLICYPVRKSMNFAHFAGFSGIIVHGPNRSEIDRHLCR